MSSEIEIVELEPGRMNQSAENESSGATQEQQNHDTDDASANDQHSDLTLVQKHLVPRSSDERVQEWAEYEGEAMFKHPDWVNVGGMYSLLQAHLRHFEKLENSGETLVYEKTYDLMRKSFLFEGAYTNRMRLDNLEGWEGLGNGSYGVVWRAVLEKTEQVAVKQMQAKPDLSINQWKERDLMILLRHKRICNLLGAFMENDVFLVMELCAGSLRCLHLGVTKSKTYVRFAIQLAQGLQWIQSKRIIHCDLRLENVLVTSRNNVVITDFGSAIMLKKGFDSVQSVNHIGVGGYQDYEANASKCYSHKNDMFAFCCVMFEVETKRMLLMYQQGGVSYEEYAYAVRRGRIHRLGDKTIERGMRRVSLSSRISTAKVLGRVMANLVRERAERWTATEFLESKELMELVAEQNLDMDKIDDDMEYPVALEVRLAHREDFRLFAGQGRLYVNRAYTGYYYDVKDDPSLLLLKPSRTLGQLGAKSIARFLLTTGEGERFLNRVADDKDKHFREMICILETMLSNVGLKAFIQDVPASMQRLSLPSIADNIAAQNATTSPPLTSETNLFGAVGGKNQQVVTTGSHNLNPLVHAGGTTAQVKNHALIEEGNVSCLQSDDGLLSQHECQGEFENIQAPQSTTADTTLEEDGLYQTPLTQRTPLSAAAPPENLEVEMLEKTTDKTSLAEKGPPTSKEKSTAASSIITATPKSSFVSSIFRVPSFLNFRKKQKQSSFSQVMIQLSPPPPIQPGAEASNFTKKKQDEISPKVANHWSHNARKLAEQSLPPAKKFVPSPPSTLKISGGNSRRISPKKLYFPQDNCLRKSQTNNIPPSSGRTSVSKTTNTEFNKGLGDYLGSSMKIKSKQRNEQQQKSTQKCVTSTIDSKNARGDPTTTMAVRSGDVPANRIGKKKDIRRIDDFPGKMSKNEHDDDTELKAADNGLGCAASRVTKRRVTNSKAGSRLAGPPTKKKKTIIAAKRSIQHNPAEQDDGIREIEDGKCDSQGVVVDDMVNIKNNFSSLSSYFAHKKASTKKKKQQTGQKNDEGQKEEQKANGYKCKHCTFTDASHDIVKEHQQQCVHHPKTKQGKNEPFIARKDGKKVSTNKQSNTKM